MPCPTHLVLSPTDAIANQQAIEAVVNPSSGPAGHARIPAGVWPVPPLYLKSGSRLSGCGIGISELRLWLPAPPVIAQPTHVLATVGLAMNGAYESHITVNDLTLNGNQQAIDWSNLSNPPPPVKPRDGSAFGLLVRNCRDSLFYDLEIVNCWTDGIMVQHFIGYNNASLRCIFDSIIIRGCGRQGVSSLAAQQRLSRCLARLNRF